VGNATAFTFPRSSHLISWQRGCGKSSQIDWSPLTAGLKLIFLMGDRSGITQMMWYLDESYNAAPERQQR